MKKVHLSNYGHGMAGMRFATILLGSITLAGNVYTQDAASIEQMVSQAMDNAGNDPVSIEAAIREVMDQVKPTAAGMKQIASTAMRKVAGFNQRGLMAAVSQATAKAALSQALSSGVNPLDATASVTDGLVSAATDTSARRGGNSVGTAKAVSQAAMQAVVEIAGGLGIPVTAAANAAAFGAMNASLDMSVDYGGNASSMARNVTAGLATGAIEGAQRLKVDPGPGANAALTGAVDSIFGKTEQNNIDPEPLVKAAQAGFNQALAAANLNVSGAGSRDSGDETNTDIIGALLEFGGSLNLEYRPAVQQDKFTITPGNLNVGSKYEVEVAGTNFTIEEGVDFDGKTATAADLATALAGAVSGVGVTADASAEDGTVTLTSNTSGVAGAYTLLNLSTTDTGAADITSTSLEDSEGGTWYLVFNPDPENPIGENVTFSFAHDGNEVQGDLTVPELKLGKYIDQAVVGKYKVSVKNEDGTELFESKPKYVSLTNTPLPPVSPST